ncbi:MAG: membrane protein insertase YidC [Candidatus Omnitrophica bacterium]|nr:membrane protein insertase YidC [Candidatus Omnitrophota bacterium]
MEKRLFLAVGLSLLVVFVFQAFFSPKSNSLKTTQSTDGGVFNSAQPAIPGTLTAVEAGAGAIKAVGAEAAEQPSFKVETFNVEAGKFDIEVANNGGSITSVYLKDYKHHFPVKGLVDLKLSAGKKFTLSTHGNTSFSLINHGQDITIEKIVTVNKYVLDIKYKITNVSKVAQALDFTTKPFDIDLSRLDINAQKSDWTLFEYAFKTEKNVERKEQVNNFNVKWNKDELKRFDWLAFRDRYFVTIVEAQDSFKSYKTTFVNAQELAFSTSLPELSVKPGSSVEYSFVVYCGPQRLDVLKEAKSGFEKVLVFSSWGWLDLIAKGIYWALGAVHKIIPVWGLCIILVSLLVYGCMYPLTLKSMMSMKKMQMLQPKMTQLKAKYKDSPEKLNKEIVELYKVNNVNPVSGCLPMLLQMPIFVGLYQVLWRSIYFRGESFLWIKDLSMPDQLFKLPFAIPFLGEYFNILPLLMMGIMFVQQMITMKSAIGGDPEQLQQQKMMAIFMPVMLGVMFYNFASGLNLYFVVFYTLSALSQWHITRDVKAAVQ